MHIKLLRPKSAAKVPHVGGDGPEMVDEDGLLSGERLHVQRFLTHVAKYRHVDLLLPSRVSGQVFYD